jgi:hypothetical protein
MVKAVKHSWNADEDWVTELSETYAGHSSSSHVDLFQTIRSQMKPASNQKSCEVPFIPMKNPQFGW